MKCCPFLSQYLAPESSRYGLVVLGAVGHSGEGGGWTEWFKGSGWCISAASRVERWLCTTAGAGQVEVCTLKAGRGSAPGVAQRPYTRETMHSALNM